MTIILLIIIVSISFLFLVKRTRTYLLDMFGIESNQDDIVLDFSFKKEKEKNVASLLENVLKSQEIDSKDHNQMKKSMKEILKKQENND